MKKLPHYIQTSADFDKLLAQFHAHITATRTIDWLSNKPWHDEPLTFQQFVRLLPDYLQFMRDFTKATQDTHGAVELPTGKVQCAHFSGYISPECTLELFVLAPILFDKFRKIQKEAIKGQA